MTHRPSSTASRLAWRATRATARAHWSAGSVRLPLYKRRVDTNSAGDRRRERLVQPHLRALRQTHLRQSISCPSNHHMLAGLIAPRGLYTLDKSASAGSRPGAHSAAWSARDGSTRVLGRKRTRDTRLRRTIRTANSRRASRRKLDAFINEFLFDEESAEVNLTRVDGDIIFDQATWLDWSVAEPAVKKTTWHTRRNVKLLTYATSKWPAPVSGPGTYSETWPDQVISPKTVIYGGGVPAVIEW